MSRLHISFKRSSDWIPWDIKRRIGHEVGQRRHVGGGAEGVVGEMCSTYKNIFILYVSSSLKIQCFLQFHSLFFD